MGTKQAADLIPLIEAAERLGWTYHKVRNWVLTGRLEGRKLYGHWVVDAASVEAAVREAGSAQPATDDGSRGRGAA